MSSRFPLVAVFLVWIFGLPALCTARFDGPSVASDVKKSRPNIVLIMADDVGFGDVSCYGAKSVVTPNIDKLASQGIRFTNGHCSASTCTPTRYSLLTGSYAFRQPNTGIAPPNSPAIIPAGTETVASLLQKAGYETAVIGKWHLGLGEKKPNWNGLLKPGPLEIGFDTCFLLPTTNDRVPQVYVRDHQVENLDDKDPLWVGNKKPSSDHPTGITHRSELKLDWTHGHNSTIHNGISRIGFYTGGQQARFRDEDLADKWVAESSKFIEQNKDKPFFLFFASHDNHVPRMPHPRFQGKTSLGFRGDAIVELDWCVGQIINKLDELKLSENTLVIFCSDNGPVLDDGYADGAIEKNGNHRAAGKYKGGKYSIYEGGTRTPFITRWTNTIKPGTSSDALVSTIDMAASLSALVSQDIPRDACLDSHDVIDALLGNSTTGRDHLVTQNNGQGGVFAYRKGKWKLLRHDCLTAYNSVVEQTLRDTPVTRFQLFDLDADPTEENDLAKTNTALAESMQIELKNILDGERTRN